VSWCGLRAAHKRRFSKSKLLPNQNQSSPCALPILRMLCPSEY
jgi:hypothetical protein